MGKRVIVVGGGIAGMQTALKLSAGGVSALLLECDADLGGKLTGWHKLFPSFTPAHEVLDELRRRLAASEVEVRTRMGNLPFYIDMKFHEQNFYL